MLTKIRVGNIDDSKEKSLERFLRESDENNLKDVLHMYGENETAVKRNEVVLNDLPGDLYTI